MKIAQLSALSAAILLATSAQANSFVDDSSMNIELRNYYKHTTSETATKLSNDQWAQGIRVDYSSGYFENIVGVDLGAYYSLKLGASNSDLITKNGVTSPANPGLLYVDSKGDAKSYGKNAYAIKFNLADMGVLKYGRMFLNLPLVNDSDSRVLPSLSEAFYGDVSYEGLSAHAVWAKKGSSKTESGFHDLEVTKDGELKSEAVKSVGAAYDFGNGMTLAADYATQSEHAKRYLVAASFSTEAEGVALDFAANYGQNQRIGASKVDDKDNKQSAYGLKATAGFGAASVSLMYTKVKKTDIGSYDDAWGGEDDTGHFGYNAVQLKDFDNNGEKTWGVNASYDFAEMVPGLVATVKYRKGDYEETSSYVAGDRNELNFDTTYAIPQLEGLSARLRYAKAKTNPDGGDTTTDTDTRVIVQYKVSVF